jgi:hypothetical protein
LVSQDNDGIEFGRLPGREEARCERNNCRQRNNEHERHGVYWPVIISYAILPTAKISGRTTRAGVLPGLGEDTLEAKCHGHQHCDVEDTEGADDHRRKHTAREPGYHGDARRT